MGLHGLAVVVLQQLQIGAVHGNGHLQLLGEKGGVLHVVQMAVGEDDEAHVPLPAQGEQLLPVARPAGVHQDGPLLPLDQVAVHVAAVDPLDPAHTRTPWRAPPSRPVSRTCRS